jgi:hypothetical protein
MGASCSGADCVSFGSCVLKRLDCLTPPSQSPRRHPRNAAQASPTRPIDAGACTPSDAGGTTDMVIAVVVQLAAGCWRGWETPLGDAAGETLGDAEPHLTAAGA